MEASSVVPSSMTSWLSKNIPKKVARNSLKSNLLENLLEGDGNRFERLFESLNLQGIESWTEQQQHPARNLMTDYQHLFAMNFSELGKTSLVQHDKKLDDVTPFKEWYERIPLHQYEEVKKHLQEMLEIGAIC